MTQRTVTQGSVARHAVDESRAIRTAALVFGLAFLAVGIAGFIPGLVTDHDAMEAAGHESGAELLGIFQVSVLHNVVHLLFGVLGLVAARRWTWARSFLIGGGLVYLVLLGYGLVVDMESDANFVPVNDADNWLHLGLGASMIVLGFLLTPRTDDTTRAAGTTRL